MKVGKNYANFWLDCISVGVIDKIFGNKIFIWQIILAVLDPLSEHATESLNLVQ